MANNTSPKEKEIEKIIIKGLRWHGIYSQKIQSGSMLKHYTPKFGPNAGREQTYRVNMAEEGTPDVFSCVPVTITPEMVGKTIGVFVATEVKRDQAEIDRWQKQSDVRAQTQFAQHELIRKAGGVVLLASSLNEVLSDIISVKKLDV